jgi:hypothetical protein
MQFGPPLENLLRRVVALLFASTLLNAQAQAQSPTVQHVGDLTVSVPHMGIGVPRLGGIDADGNFYWSGTLAHNLNVEPEAVWTFGESTLISRGRGDAALIKMDSSGKLIWGKAFGGSAPDYAHHCGVDSKGNVILTGSLTPPFTLEGETIGEVSGEERSSMFVAKYSPEGKLLWFKRTLGQGIAHGGWVTIDAQDNIVVLGRVEGTESMEQFTVETRDIRHSRPLLTKFTPSGELLWFKTHGTNFSLSGYSQGSAGGFDSGGNLLVSGHISLPEGSAELFVAKYDPAGNLIWDVRATNAQSARLAVTTNDDVVVAASIFGDITFGTTTYTKRGTGYSDSVIARFSPAGNLRWARHAAAPPPGTPETLALQPSQGGGVIAGSYYFKDPNTMINGLVEYDLDGKVVWSKWGLDFSPYHIVRRPHGDLFTANSESVYKVTFNEPLRLTSALVDGAVVLRWKATQGSVQLQSCTDLSAPVWNVLTNGIIRTDTDFVLTNQLNAPQQFFRLVQLPVSQ